MYRQLFSNWNALRFFRLILGVTVIVQGIFTHDWMIGLFGVVFASMPLFNYGCCGVNGCAVPVYFGCTARCDCRLFVLAAGRLCFGHLQDYIQTIEQYIVWRPDGHITIGYFQERGEDHKRNKRPA